MGHTVQIDDHRVLYAQSHSDRLHQERLYFVLVVVAGEAERLDIPKFLAVENIGI